MMNINDLLYSFEIIPDLVNVILDYVGKYDIIPFKDKMFMFTQGDCFMSVLYRFPFVMSYAQVLKRSKLIGYACPVLGLGMCIRIGGNRTPKICETAKEAFEYIRKTSRNDPIHVIAFSNRNARKLKRIIQKKQKMLLIWDFKFPRWILFHEVP